jgi:hypothetical protein
MGLGKTGMEFDPAQLCGSGALYIKVFQEAVTDYC